jgi:hypothetical protein
MYRLTNAGADAAGMAAGATAGSGSGVEWPLCAETGRSPERDSAIGCRGSAVTLTLRDDPTLLFVFGPVDLAACKAFAEDSNGLRPVGSRRSAGLLLSRINNGRCPWLKLE